MGTIVNNLKKVIRIEMVGFSKKIGLKESRIEERPS